MTATIDDIARLAKVSTATVSRVLNNSGYVKLETRERIEKVIKDMNYVPNAIARSLSRSESRTIGIIVPDITNSYFGEIIKGISEVAEKNGLSIILFNTNNDVHKEIRAINEANEHRLKGIILTPGFGRDTCDITEFNEAIKSFNGPVILVSADLKGSNLNGVFIDNFKAGYEVTDRFIKEGHTKIGIMTGLLSSEPAYDRLLGYKKALVDNNISVKDEYILNGDFTLQRAYKLTKEIILSKDMPTALVVSSNMMTLGVIKALLEEGLSVPNDIALIGFNKIDLLDIVGLHISYVDDSPIELGRVGTEILLHKLNFKDEVEIIRSYIPAKIILKGSEKSSINNRQKISTHI